VSLVPFVQLECGMSPLDWRPFWTGLCESVAVYTLDHLYDLRKARDSKEATKLRVGILGTLLVASLVGFFASIIACPSSRIVGTFSVHLLLCVAYAKLKPRMPYMKAVYVSLCVVFMAFAAPAAYMPGLLSSAGLGALTRMLILIFGVSFTVENLQDIRDVAEDRLRKVVTLPSGMGVPRTRSLLLALQATSVVLHLVITRAAQLPLRLDLLGIYGVCGLITMAFDERTPRWRFQVVLEPLYVAPLLMSLIIRAGRIGPM